MSTLEEFAARLQQIQQEIAQSGSPPAPGSDVMRRLNAVAAEMTVDAGRREVYLKLARQWTEAAAALQTTPNT